MTPPPNATLFLALGRWAFDPKAMHHRQGGEEMRGSMRYLDWIAVPMLLLGAAMLLVDIGAPGLWIAVIAVGIALVAIDAYGRKHPHPTV
jgi:hypothetical protein